MRIFPLRYSLRTFMVFSLLLLLPIGYLAHHSADRAKELRTINEIFGDEVNRRVATYGYEDDLISGFLPLT